MPSKDDKRSRILKAAVKVFAQLGFYNAKVSQIAKNAGIADGTIYLYFKNKDEILISIFEEEMAKFISKVSKEIESAADVKNKLRVFAKTHLNFVKNNPRLAQVFQLELRQSNKFIKEYAGSKLKEYLNVAGDIIEEGQRHGVIRKDIHPGLIKRALFGSLDEVATHWVLMKNGKYDLEKSAEQIADIFINGIAKT
ncbi:TetR/AcrR family transcriptional regulator [candidate division KSB1 bacterium]|nr:TetR/AcrR family transcriptional regulator [candidate division KSB1 bacterium]